jgi:hypothetical protein
MESVRSAQSCGCSYLCGAQEHLTTRRYQLQRLKGNRCCRCRFACWKGSTRHSSRDRLLEQSIESTCACK